MSVNKLVSIDNVIINLLDSMGLDHTKFKPMFTNWIVQGEKEIGSYYQFVRSHAVIDIKGCVAELPCNAKYLELAILGDFGCDCSDLFTKFAGGALNAQVTSGNIDSTSFLVVDLPSSATAENGFFGFGMVDYKVQDNKVILDRNFNGQKLTVQYLGLKLDCDGIPMVGENHLLALEEFCRWKFSRRRIRSGIDVGVSRDHERLWNQYCASARGDDAQPSAAEQEMIAKILHNPFSGRGLKLTPMDRYRGGYSNIG